MERKLPVWLFLLVILLGLAASVLFGWSVRHVLNGGTRLGAIGEISVTVAAFPSLVREAFTQVATDTPLVIDNRFPTLDGFRKDGVLTPGALEDRGFLLLSAYDGGKGQSTVQLIRIRDQQVLHEWAPDAHELARHNPESAFVEPQGVLPDAYRLGHPLPLSDGGIVFHNFRGPLFKVNACSSVEWVVDGVFHHSIEQGPNGHLWVPAIIEPTGYDPGIFPGYRDDSIAEVSPDGRLLSHRSVSEILEQNGHIGLLFGAGPYDADAIHLNDVQPAHRATPYWEQGDLLLSLRHRSTVFLYRPATGEIPWLQTGPWLNQHDANFVGDSTVSVFGNDVVRVGKDQKSKLVHGYNDVYLFDLSRHHLETPYTDVLKDHAVRTLTEGRSLILDDGDLFLEEQNDGRLLRVGVDGVKWEFVAKTDDGRVSFLNWSRYLTEDQVSEFLPALERAACG